MSTQYLSQTQHQDSLNLKINDLSVDGNLSATSQGGGGSGDFVINTSGEINLQSTSLTDDLIIDSDSKSVVINAGEAVADAVSINALNAAGGVALSSAGTQGITLQCSNALGTLDIVNLAGKLTIDNNSGESLVEMDNGLDLSSTSALTLTCSGPNGIELNSPARAPSIKIDDLTRGPDLELTHTLSVESDTGTFQYVSTGAGTFNITIPNTDNAKYWHLILTNPASSNGSTFTCGGSAHFVGYIMTTAGPVHSGVAGTNSVLTLGTNGVNDWFKFKRLRADCISVEGYVSTGTVSFS